VRLSIALVEVPFPTVEPEREREPRVAENWQMMQQRRRKMRQRWLLHRRVDRLQPSLYTKEEAAAMSQRERACFRAPPPDATRSVAVAVCRCC